MRSLDERLAACKQSLCQKLEISGLYARNPVAHKWKAPFRSISLRESVAWRTQDLLEQSVHLFDADYVLGARILLRSALETVAILIYLNQTTRQVIAGELGFHHFSDKTAILLLGSRDESTAHKSLSIITVLGKCNKRYPGIESIYARLCESAHPNYEGSAIGYSDIDREQHVITYKNKWKSMYGDVHLEWVEACYELFYSEYNNEWPAAFEELESWIAEHDSMLEATKGKA